MMLIRRAFLLLSVCVALIACGGEGGTAEGTTASADSGATLTVQGVAFGQPPAVAAGDTFTIVNLDSTRHTFTSSDGAWEQVDLPAETEVQFTVPASLAPGSYPFVCTIHPSMSGNLTVSG
ncbi:MAG: cupredoxin domain-containing protein [Acidimicrobiia bacterium]